MVESSLSTTLHGTAEASPQKKPCTGTATSAPPTPSLWVPSPNMLRDGDMQPMTAHNVQESGCNIFYALGHELYGNDYDE